MISVAGISSHLYDKSDEFYEKREGFSACACMGAVEGEPMCPCQMAKAGLPLSKSHVESNKKAREELTVLFTKYGVGCR